MRSPCKIVIALAIAYASFLTTLATVRSPDTSQAQNVTETVHYITLKFTQSSFTLSISQHIKDKANTFYVTLPTTKKFYDSVKEGDLLNSKFKTATFLLDGHIGSRKVYVHKKFTKQER